MWNEKQAKRLGEEIRRARGQKGISQESLAHRSGITKNQLQLIEAGRSSGSRDASGPSNPRMSTLAGVAAVLDVSVSELLASAGL